MRIALTGGIGSGKSTVARLLAEHGAVVVDADAIAREVVEPGTPGLAAVVAEFGPGVLLADGSLDRAALAGIVFPDPVRRAALESILHPLIARRSQELIEAVEPGRVVVYDVPLLAELRAAAPDVPLGETVVVVETPLELRVARLVDRGLTEADARARIAAQATDADRRALADHVIHNDTDLTTLAAQVATLWNHLTTP